eukprot:CAMPEP_0113514698 /NCGR_PEP_ID=MMETSP0014_2-20120614/40549_1 /TAXON_ID=2857 /ORGANISM="Nitzschia sp." /LENGTH=271 /DNA_ID=CAMNT_0000411215 /DNA_START=208 /DNA_END=1023 /DNA_ORIENTATION=- /assembly_acc=CAM_ASM_000159
MPATTTTATLNQKSNSSMRRQSALADTTASFSEPSSSSSTSSSPQLPPIEAAPAVDHPLIQAAHKFAYSQSGFYSPYDESMFSDEFVFRGPYIGPLNKQDYLSTMDTFGIYKAFPDISPNCFGYSIDPQNPNRVWFMVRNTGTFTGEPGLGFGGDAYFPPNGATLQGSPETFSIIFDEDQKVKHLTVGYVADRFEGNTAGKGAAVGIFHVIGLPFPSPGPGLKLAQWLGTEVANMGAKSYSTENIPSWWKSEEKASEVFFFIGRIHLRNLF